MRIVERQQWQANEEVNQDKGYGEAVIIFTTLWATLMEIAILFEDMRKAGGRPHGAIWDDGFSVWLRGLDSGADVAVW